MKPLTFAAMTGSMRMFEPLKTTSEKKNKMKFTSDYGKIAGIIPTNNIFTLAKKLLQNFYW